ncbi:MAG: hypothetical protein KatS3mg068_0610 [Candidatus Sericytochromatia bacterium]|nr:MAG: hypothetical protein KatS3mg068_0610 [Candidatus Sericytochromatia bacterium]
MKNSKSFLMLISTLIIFSCSINNSVSTDKTKSSNNEIVNIKPSNISHIELKNDENLIKDFINNNPDFFPLDLNVDNSSQATVPNNGGVIFATIPNNGGVIFSDDNDSFSIKSYSIKQLKLPIKNIQIPQRPKLIEKLKNNIPIQWTREVIDKPRREIKIYFEKKDKAKAIVNTFFNKKIVLNFENKREIVKKLSEVSTRIAYFTKENNNWVLNSVSPFEFRPENKTINVNIEFIKITVNSNDKGNIFNIPINGFINKKDMPTIKKGSTLKIEVKAINNEPNEIPPLYVYLRLPDIGVKIPMYDDGSLEDLFTDKEGKQVSTDDINDDNIYTATIKMSKNLGVNNITIDAISSLSLQDSLENGDYISKSFPIIITQ